MVSEMHVIKLSPVSHHLQEIQQPRMILLS